MPNNVSDLGKIIVAKGLQKIAQSDDHHSPKGSKTFRTQNYSLNTYFSGSVGVAQILIFGITLNLIFFITYHKKSPNVYKSCPIIISL